MRPARRCVEEGAESFTCDFGGGVTAVRSLGDRGDCAGDSGVAKGVGCGVEDGGGSGGAGCGGVEDGGAGDGEKGLGEGGAGGC
ncbi:hypothetical protein V501_05039 [Pseudogymnoascus sp. VKM F-4519 (FW-2642)]|nr:hypothetical protein V501_05039 [Pseudogymnoascus sp. VKM F-4519 (FW-2642)]